jgi:hypothetical protein
MVLSPCLPAESQTTVQPGHGPKGASQQAWADRLTDDAHVQTEHKAFPTAEVLAGDASQVMAVVESVLQRILPLGCAAARRGIVVDNEGRIKQHDPSSLHPETAISLVADGRTAIETEVDATAAQRTCPEGHASARRVVDREWSEHSGLLQFFKRRQALEAPVPRAAAVTRRSVDRGPPSACRPPDWWVIDHWAGEPRDSPIGEPGLEDSTPVSPRHGVVVEERDDLAVTRCDRLADRRKVTGLMHAKRLDAEPVGDVPAWLVVGTEHGDHSIVGVDLRLHGSQTALELDGPVV